MVGIKIQLPLFSVTFSFLQGVLLEGNINQTDVFLAFLVIVSVLHGFVENRFAVVTAKVKNGFHLWEIEMKLLL